MAVAVTPAVAIADEVLALAHSAGEVLVVCEDASVNDVNVNAFAVDFAGVVNAIDDSVDAVDAPCCVVLQDGCLNRLVELNEGNSFI
jgi:hypothetical protein